MSDPTPPDAVLDAALPEQPVRRLDPLASRASYGTFAVDPGDGAEPLVLKYTSVAGWRLRKAAAVLGHVALVDGVPVPAVRSVGTVAAPEDDWTFLLTTKCDGATCRAVVDDEPGRHREVARTVGRVLAHLHEGASFDRPGVVVAGADAGDSADGGRVREVAGADDGTTDDEPAATGGNAPALALSETPTTWPGVLRDLVASMADVLVGTAFERSGERARSVLDGHLDDLAVSDAVLLHGDPDPENVLVADGTLSCLLDWEYARVGDPAFDVTAAAARLSDERSPGDLPESLLAGYREVRPVPETLHRRWAVYRVVHAVGHVVGLAGGSEGAGSTTVDPERSRRARAELARCIERLEDGEEQD